MSWEHLKTAPVRMEKNRFHLEIKTSIQNFQLPTVNCSKHSVDLPQSALGMVIQVRLPNIHQVPDPTGTGMIFYLQLVSVPDLNRDGYETSIFFTRG
jgi:hypothetical protein